MALKYTKWPKYIPNGHKSYQHLSLQDTPISTQSWIFGLKIYDLATLEPSRGANKTFFMFCA
jgi:hypothetical protein